MDALSIVLAVVMFAILHRAGLRDRRDMSGADLFGLIASALVCLYLLYALLRGEKF